MSPVQFPLEFLIGIFIAGRIGVDRAFGFQGFAGELQIPFLFFQILDLPIPDLVHTNLVFIAQGGHLVFDELDFFAVFADLGAGVPARPTGRLGACGEKESRDAQ